MLIYIRFILILGVHGYSSSVVVDVLISYNLDNLTGDNSAHFYYVASNCSNTPTGASGFLINLGCSYTATKAQYFINDAYPNYKEAYCRVYNEGWQSWQRMA